MMFSFINEYTTIIQNCKCIKKGAVCALVDYVSRHFEGSLASVMPMYPVSSPCSFLIGMHTLPCIRPFLQYPMPKARATTSVKPRACTSSCTGSRCSCTESRPVNLSFFSSFGSSVRRSAASRIGISLMCAKRPITSPPRLAMKQYHNPFDGVITMSRLPRSLHAGHAARYCPFSGVSLRCACATCAMLCLAAMALKSRFTGSSSIKIEPVFNDTTLVLLVHSHHVYNVTSYELIGIPLFFLTGFCSPDSITLFSLHLPSCLHTLQVRLSQFVLEGEFEGW